MVVHDPHGQTVKRDAVAAAVLEIGKAREVYLDEEIATDGPFTILLTLYRHRDITAGLSIGAVFEASDARMSTATYVLDRLVDWGYIERIGRGAEERYRLAASTERSLDSYLNDCVGKMERGGLCFGSPGKSQA